MNFTLTSSDTHYLDLLDKSHVVTDNLLLQRNEKITMAVSDFNCVFTSRCKILV